jgi:glycerol kinase
MNEYYYLGIDQGTTGTTTLLLNHHMQQIGIAHEDLHQIYPQPGWIEQDPMEIVATVKSTAAKVFAGGNIPFGQIRCIGLDNQGETVVVWDKSTGLPVYNAIVWQDRRTAKYADQLRGEYGDMIYERTGLVVDSYFSATKIKWILDHDESLAEKVRRGEICAGTLDAWIIWNMTGGRSFVTDVSTASRTMMMNIHTGTWDQDILQILDIPVSILPEILCSADDFGMTDPDSFFGHRIPITGSAVDQQAALFGEVCYTPGMVKTTFGTGAFMLMNVGEQPLYSKNGLLTTVAWGLKEKETGISEAEKNAYHRKRRKMTYALDGGVYIAGAAVTWLRDKMKLIVDAAETEEIAIRAGSNGGVFFVPAFSGLAAPHWDQYARGTIIGLTAGSTREELIRATLESQAYQVKDNLMVMEEDSGIPITAMRADGGSVRNRFLMQFLADILNIPVEIPEISETSALGAAYLAGLGRGDFASLSELSDKWKTRMQYEPKMSEEEREGLLHYWHKAVSRSRDWYEETAEIKTSGSGR